MQVSGQRGPDSWLKTDSYQRSHYRVKVKVIITSQKKDYFSKYYCYYYYYYFITYLRYLAYIFTKYFNIYAVFAFRNGYYHYYKGYKNIMLN